MLAALTMSTGSETRSSELLGHGECLVVRLQDPYLRTMLTPLTVSKERLAIALEFLNDRELASYLRRVQDRCIHSGDIDSILVSG